MLHTEILKYIVTIFTFAYFNFKKIIQVFFMEWLQSIQYMKSTMGTNMKIKILLVFSLTEKCYLKVLIFLLWIVAEYI